MKHASLAFYAPQLLYTLSHQVVLSVLQNDQFYLLPV